MDHPKPADERPDAPACMFCSCDEFKYPLIPLRLQGGEAFVCPRCLPRLVHPERR